MDDLKALRLKIDKIDEQIIKLIEERLKLANMIGIIKDQQGLPLTDTKREKEKINTLTAMTSDHILRQHIEKIFKILFSMSKKLRGKKPYLA